MEDLEHEVKHCQQEMEEQEKRSSRKCEVLQQELVTLKVLQPAQSVNHHWVLTWFLEMGT